MDKKKYDVTIADVEMSIISDEREEFVMKLVEKLDSEIKDLLLHSKRSTKIDAALLLALDYSCGKAKAEKRVRNLEAQIALYDANLRRMREENIKLRGAILKGKDAEKMEDLVAENTDDGDISSISPTISGEEAVSQLTITDDELPSSVDNPAENTEDVHFDGNGADDAQTAPASKEDKLRQIADLLGRKKDN